MHKCIDYLSLSETDFIAIRYVHKLYSVLLGILFPIVGKNKF